MRRLTAGALLLLGVLLCAYGPGTAETGRRVMLIYVSAWDCVYCAQWERFSQPPWEKSEIRQDIDFRIVKAAAFRSVDDDRYWPRDIRWVRDALKIRRGTPRFVVVVDGTIVLHRFGTGAWDQEIYPALERAVLKTRPE